MAEENQKSDDQKSPQPLAYLAPDQDEDKKRSIRLTKIFAGVMTSIAVFVGVLIFFFSALSFSPGGPKTQSNWGALIVPGIIAAFVMSLTAYEHFIVRRVGFLQGVLIGLGVATLIEGACFLAFLR